MGYMMDRIKKFIKIKISSKKDIIWNKYENLK